MSEGAREANAQRQTDADIHFRGQVLKRLDRIILLLEQAVNIDPSERLRALSDDDIATIVQRVEAVQPAPIRAETTQ